MPKFEVIVKETWSGSKIVEADSADEAVNQVLDDDSLETSYEMVDEAYAYPCCKFCGQGYPFEDMRLHQGTYVCPDCWDERLATTA